MSNKDDRHISLYTAIAFCAFVLLFFAIFCRVVVLKTIDKPFWDQKFEEWTIKKKRVDAKRGNIYAIDADTGERLLLATNERYWDLYIDLGKSKAKKNGVEVSNWVVSDSVYKSEIKNVCRKLAEIFPNSGKTATDYYNHFQKYRKKEARYVLVQKKITDEQLEQIKQLPILGAYRTKTINGKKTKVYRLSNAVFPEEKYRRIYPYGSLARRTIGINVRNGGSDTTYDGIDGEYDRYLKGIHGERLVKRFIQGQYIPLDQTQDIKVPDGDDIVTTIDVSLQELAENALRKCLDSNDAKSGTVILMETHTGYIKALANLTRTKDGNYAEIENIGVMSCYEPGSTFKIVTAMMLLDKGLVDTSQIVPTSIRKFPNVEKAIRDVGNVDHGNVSFTRALELSSNVGISSIVYDFYGKNNETRTKFINDLHEYFMYKRLDCDIALHEPLPYIRETNRLDDILRLSFGYVTAMTPLQMLTFYNGIANNGKVMKPMFVSQVLKDGVVKEQFEPIVLKEQMCKQSTLLKIQDVLERVVLYGTGKKLRSAPYGIAGKSGTAEIGYDNTSQVLRHRASFVGYFPADNPQYSCIVVISEPHKALTHGGDLAAPVFRELSDRVIGSGLASYKSKVNEDKVVRPVMNYGHAGDYAALCRNLGFMDTYSDIWIKAIVTDSAVHYNPVKIKEGIMPEVKGLTLKDAVYMLEKMGLKVEIQGYGRVVSQSIEKNQPINKGDKVVLTAGRL